MDPFMRFWYLSHLQKISLGALADEIQTLRMRTANALASRRICARSSEHSPIR